MQENNLDSPKQLVIKELNMLTGAECVKVYKYIRRHLIANIPGLKDPVPDDTEENRGSWQKRFVKELKNRGLSEEHAMIAMGFCCEERQLAYIDGQTKAWNAIGAKEPEEKKADYDNNKFDCPKCGSYMFGSSENEDGTLTRHCHGDEIRNCDFSWHQRDDYKYFTRPRMESE